MKRGEPVFHLRSYGDVSAEDLEWYAAQHKREPHEDSSFPLKDGTQADPRQAWVLPSNEQEK